jgi:nucleotide-binding universal stress UspA family protein
VLICFDGSGDSRQAIVRAAELFPDRPALVLHVWEPLKDVASVPPVPGLSSVLRGGLDEMDRMGADISRETAEEGARVAADAGLSAEPLSIQARGRAWRGILAAAREHDVATIVMGRRGIGGAERVLLGSVSNGVLHGAERPVVIVPEEEDGAR